MNRRRRSTGAFLALSAFLALPLASRAAHAAQPAKLVIAYAAVTARIMPLLIAQDQGYFAKYGIDSQPVLIRGGTPLVVGLAAGDIQIGRTAGAAVLSAVASGHDLKMVATFTSRNSYNVVVKSTIKRPEDIRGKRIAINSYGGGTWVGTMLWLEHFGLDPQRDNILLQSFGDQSMQAQALDTGAVDVVFVDTFYANWLKNRGFVMLADYTELKQPLVSQSTVAQRSFLQQREDLVENYLKSEIEAMAFACGPKNKAATIKLLMRRLRTDAAGAEDAYVDLMRGVERKPFASLDGMRNLQRLLKGSNPKIAALKVDDIVDNRIMRRLDESGFIERTYAAQGVSLK
ncbi:MAG TPA: ABC transporter substrate-binding protein [Candidatus Binatia bacterium]|nr:ABC transporter substrate-binding protein [Candidatus Binatia bacterium]